jgi:hypothetical protein
MRFRLWASDYRRADEAHVLRTLARLDPDEFFHRHPVDPTALVPRLAHG